MDALGLTKSASDQLNQDLCRLSSLALADKEAIVMHPGPVNRGVEIDSKVADGKRSLILSQVTNGIAIRMAVMSMAMQPDSRERGN